MFQLNYTIRHFNNLLEFLFRVFLVDRDGFVWSLFPGFCILFTQKCIFSPKILIFVVFLWAIFQNMYEISYVFFFWIFFFYCYSKTLIFNVAWSYVLPAFLLSPYSIVLMLKFFLLHKISPILHPFCTVPTKKKHKIEALPSLICKIKINPNYFF